MKKIGFVTCADLKRYFVSEKNPLYSHDDQVAADYLVERGFKVEPVIWGLSPEVLSGSGYDLLIIRSPWDYADSDEKRSQFAKWLKGLIKHKVPLQNDGNLMLWNLDKHYLLDFQNCGVNVVPTEFVPQGSRPDLLKRFDDIGPLVVKPCISAAARDTFLLSSPEEIKEFSASFDELKRGRDFMVQPFLPEVKKQGEYSLVFIDGEYSHAVHKRPKPGGWLVQDELGGSVISMEADIGMIKTAKEVFAQIIPAALRRWQPTILKDFKVPLYARIDFIKMGKIFCLSEIELIEPELFFLTRHGERNEPNEVALKLLERGIRKFI